MTDWANLDAWYRQGRNLIDALGPQTPQTPAGTWAEYNAPLFGKKAHFVAVALKDGNGTIYPPPYPQFSYYDTHPQASPLAKPGDICGVADWAGSWEYHRQPVDGAWSYVDGYGTAAGAFYPLEVIKAEAIDLKTGALTDITPPSPAPQGQPFAPTIIPASGTIRRRVWGWTWNSMSGGRANQYFEQLDFDFGLFETNPAWQGSGPQNRQVIRIWDAWWSAGMWVEATADKDPFDDHGNPVAPTVNYQRSNDMARLAGSFWDYETQGWLVKLQSMVPT